MSELNRAEKHYAAATPLSEVGTGCNSAILLKDGRDNSARCFLLLQSRVHPCGVSLRCPLHVGLPAGAVVVGGGSPRRNLSRATGKPERARNSGTI